MCEYKIGWQDFQQWAVMFSSPKFSRWRRRIQRGRDPPPPETPNSFTPPSPNPCFATYAQKPCFTRDSSEVQVAPLSRCQRPHPAFTLGSRVKTGNESFLCFSIGSLGLPQTCKLCASERESGSTFHMSVASNILTWDTDERGYAIHFGRSKGESWLSPVPWQHGPWHALLCVELQAGHEVAFARGEAPPMAATWGRSRRTWLWGAAREKPNLCLASTASSTETDSPYAMQRTSKRCRKQRSDCCWDPKIKAARSELTFNKSWRRLGVWFTGHSIWTPQCFHCDKVFVSWAVWAAQCTEQSLSCTVGLHNAIPHP